MGDADSLIEAVQNAIDGALPGEDAKAAIAAVRRWEAVNGWRCVPVKADVDMILAAANEYFSAQRAWNIIISASPPPPGSAEGVKE